MLKVHRCTVIFLTLMVLALIAMSEARVAGKARRNDQVTVDDETLYQYAKSFVTLSKSQEADEDRDLVKRGRSCHHDVSYAFYLLHESYI